MQLSCMLEARPSWVAQEVGGHLLRGLFRGSPCKNKNNKGLSAATLSPSVKIKIKIKKELTFEFLLIVSNFRSKCQTNALVIPVRKVFLCVNLFEFCDSNFDFGSSNKFKSPHGLAFQVQLCRPRIFPEHTIEKTMCV